MNLEKSYLRKTLTKETVLVITKTFYGKLIY